MLKWFIGVSSAVILALCGWSWTFVLMGYQAKADIKILQVNEKELVSVDTELKAELKAVKEISLRTEKNTEAIRDYLLKRAVKSDSQN